MSTDTSTDASCYSETIISRLREADRIWLFLDYDGTLADFAPTPEHVEPDPAVLDLLNKLKQYEQIRLTVLSGRRLSHVKDLLPLAGIIKAGTYGIELQLPSGEEIERLDFERVRPVLEKIKPQWESLLSRRKGFFLEDKGWSLAIHAKDARDDETEMVLNKAEEVAWRSAETGVFRILGGHKFLEIGPQIANKGNAVEYIIEAYPWPNAILVYVGDDDKDEEAFEPVQEHGGIAVVVASPARESRADCRLESPMQVHRWLDSLPAYLNLT
jgi:trehalose 6-phosphate phosphatase